MPIEPIGRVVAAITMCCGIIVFALPLAVLGANFRDVYEEYKSAVLELRNQENAPDHLIEKTDLLKELSNRREALSHAIRQVCESSYCQETALHSWVVDAVNSALNVLHQHVMDSPMDTNPTPVEEMV